MEVLFCLVGIAVVVGLVILVMYNGLIGKKNAVDQAYSSVDVMLKKRYDLIPNLVSAVQAYLSHERGLLTELTELRSRAMGATASPDARVVAENQLSSVLGRVMVVAEAYPDLKASDNFVQLQASLNEIEEQLSAARRAYNAAVTDLNNAIEMVPTNIIAGMMQLRRRELFAAAETERANVNVGQLFGNGR
ncbi:MAG: LemA family protein [Chloroflexi bacterium]|nr:LemA family protein [Chloroflexota bacterium]